MSIPMQLLNKLKFRFMLGKLQLKHFFSKEDVYINYGWIELIFSNDGDAQEIYYHANCLKWYEKDIKTFGNYLNPGDVVVDVGANLGFVATMFASLVAEKGKVFCFEPSKYVFSKLLKTISKNSLSQVIPYNLGCGRESKKVVLNKVYASSGNSSIVSSKIVPNSSEEIEIVALDSIEELRQHKIKFLKIDTEGYEPEVLLGAKSLISNNKPVIYIEMGGDYIESTKKSLKILEEYGYKTLIPDDIDWTTIGNGCNFFSLPIN